MSSVLSQQEKHLAHGTGGGGGRGTGTWRLSQALPSNRESSMKNLSHCQLKALKHFLPHFKSPMEGKKTHTAAEKAMGDVDRATPVRSHH